MNPKKNKYPTFILKTLDSKSLFSHVIIIIASLSVLNSYNGDFVFDDTEAILNNADIKSTSFTNIFKHDFWGTKISNKNSHKSYRPLTVTSYKFNYLYRGELVPQDFHITNIVLHSISCVLTWYVYQIFLEWEKPDISFYAALLYAVHPVHTEAVCGIVGRADVLSGLFTWLSIIFFTKSIHTSSNLVKYVTAILCTLCIIIAMLCKETGIMALCICFMYDLVIVNKLLPLDGERIRRLKYSNIEIKNFLNTRHPFLVRSLSLLLAGVLLLLFRFYIMGFTRPIFKPHDNPASFIDQDHLKILNYNYIYSLNLWLLICPCWLCFDWSMGCVPLINGPDLRILSIILLWIFFGLMMKAALLRKSQEHQYSRHVAMSLVLLIFPFIPATNLIFTVGFVLAERILYIPSAGYCLLFAIGFKNISNFMHLKISLTIYYIIILIFFSRSWLRSEQWKTELLLFKSGAQVCPLNAKVHYNIAKSFSDTGNITFAKEEYQLALSLNPVYAQAMNNLGNLFKDEGNYTQAEKLLKQALLVQNDFSAAWMNLGIVLSATSKFEEAETSYLTAIYHRPFYPDCYYNLGLLYLAKQDYENAQKSWEMAIKQQVNHQKAWSNLILLLDNRGMQKVALKKSYQALQHLPEDPLIHFNMGNILGKLENFKEAETHFNKAITLDTKNSIFYTNLGVLYHRWKKFNKAETMYRKSLEINPNSTIAKKNLEKLLYSKSKLHQNAL